MTILIIHAHNENRGDEAAVKAMVDELIQYYPDARIYISNMSRTEYPNMPANVKQIERFTSLRSHLYLFEFISAYLSNGKIVFSNPGKEFIRVLKEADIVLHAPGGPSIGDTYSRGEILYLLRLDMIRRMGKKYFFYAPSMGPFNATKRKKLRKRVLNGAEMITLRDPISVQYLTEFMPNVRVEQTLDSALQHDIDKQVNQNKFEQYNELKSFLLDHEKCIGMTITDLKWHPTQSDNPKTASIKSTFGIFIKRRVDEGYGIIFIPQLYGGQNDFHFMSEFMLPEHTFILTDGSHQVDGRDVYDSRSDVYDSYFQQYLIGKLDMVIGMRYHSNIFSAKMGTPFISISYEQKMSGFMQTMGLEEYCLDLNEFSIDALEAKYQRLRQQYTGVKKQLLALHDVMKVKSHRTTEAVIDILSEQI